MSSLDRLIRLARRTGDTLIIHDSVQGRDVVVMDIDAYEALLDSQVALDDRESFDDDMSWNDDLDVTDEWHSAGAVLQDQYSDQYDEPEWVSATQDAEPEDPVLEGQLPFDGQDIPTMEMTDGGHRSPKPAYFAQGQQDQDDEAPPTAFDVPYQPYHGELSEDTWEEELSLDEEPVFYEEPIS